jgi:hypothetical protein
MNDPLEYERTRICACNHTAYWHMRGGEGACDDCDCTAFTRTAPERFQCARCANEAETWVMDPWMSQRPVCRACESTMP